MRGLFPAQPLLSCSGYLQPPARLHCHMPTAASFAFRINNAGTNAYKYGPLTDSSDEDLQEIVQTNVLGIMLCCREVCERILLHGIFSGAAFFLTTVMQNTGAVLRSLGAAANASACFSENTMSVTFLALPCWPGLCCKASG